MIALFGVIAESISEIVGQMHFNYKEKGLKYGLVSITYSANKSRTEGINFILPFYPYFMDCFSRISVSFEGAPVVPRLYTNAKNKHFFVRNLNRGLICLALI